MKILLEVSPLTTGGPQAWVCDIAPALRQRGAEVEVVSFELTPTRDTLCLEMLHENGIPVRRGFLSGSWFAKHRTLRSSFLAAGSCDIVHFNSDVFSGLLIPFAKHIPVRIVHARTPHWGLRSKGLWNRLLHPALRWQARCQCTHAFGVTREALEAVLGSGRAARAIPGEVVPSAIRASRFLPCARDRAGARHGPGATQITLGFIGRLTASKHPDFLVTIASRLVRRGVETGLVLIGAGPEEEAIRALAIREGLSQFVTILPPCGNIAKVMTNQMDVLLLPSDFEGTPRVVLEAQACGVPVVCSTAVTEDVRIVPELFHRLGLLDGPDAWAEKVLQIGTMRIPREQIAAHFAHSPCEIENQADLLLDRYHRFRNSLPRRS